MVANQGGSLYAGMAEKKLQKVFKVAHFQPEQVAHFAPEGVAQFAPEQVAQYRPE
jgi:hypothetical protein